MSDQDRFNNFVIRKHPLEVYGSYDIFDKDEKRVGSSRGFTVKRRYISFISNISHTKYIISKGDNKTYFIIKEDDIEATLQLKTLSHIVLTCMDNKKYALVPSFLGSAYKINTKKGNVGIISCSDWIYKDVGLSITNLNNINYVLGAIIAMGYDYNSSPWAMLATQPS